MLKFIFNLIASIAAHIFRRGPIYLKLIFAVDDFIRLFTMTILLPIFTFWLGLPNWAIGLACIFGFVIDIHDFISQYGNKE